MEIEPGKTMVAYWPFHILELRAALEAVMEIVNNHDAAHGGLVSVDWQNIVDVENHDTGQGDAEAVDWQHIGTGRPRAAVMNQFRDLILGI